MTRRRLPVHGGNWSALRNWRFLRDIMAICALFWHKKNDSCKNYNDFRCGPVLALSIVKVLRVLFALCALRNSRMRTRNCEKLLISSISSRRLQICMISQIALYKSDPTISNDSIPLTAIFIKDHKWGYHVTDIPLGQIFLKKGRFNKVNRYRINGVNIFYFILKNVYAFIWRLLDTPLKYHKKFNWF